MNSKAKNLSRDGVAMVVVAAVAGLLGSQIPRIYDDWRGNERRGDFSRHVSDQPYAVTLYGTTTCQHCQSARAYLQGAGIAFNDRLVDQSPEAREVFALLEEKGVPVLVFKDRLIVGFRFEQYQQSLVSMKK